MSAEITQSADERTQPFAPVGETAAGHAAEPAAAEEVRERAEDAGLDWLEANQRQLMAELAVLRDTLERHVAGDGPEPAGAEAERRSDELRAEAEAARRALPGPSALDVLADVFDLSDFERKVVLFAAGPELEASFASVCAAAQGDPRRDHPTFGLALAALPGAHWSATSSAAALRRWRLVELGPGDVLTAAPLRVDERILGFLTGVLHPDERLAGLLTPLPAEDDPGPAQAEQATRIARAWAQNPAECPLVELCGRDRSGRRMVVARAAAELGLGTWRLDAADVPAAAGERERFLRLLERETALGGAAILIECADDAEDELQRRLGALLERLHGRLAVGSREPLGAVADAGRRRILHLEVAKPGVAESRELWHRELPDAGDRLSDEIDAVAGQFRLDLRALRRAAAEVRSALEETDAADEKAVGHLLWDACRLQSRARLEELAQRLESSMGWDDLVLPPAQKRLLGEIEIHVRRRARVHEEWGFAAKGSRGLGISALFAGESGTGKTLAAEVLAQRLRLDLYRIDLSTVVSKYIGETEKNLKKVFDAAEDGGAVLLFDEADALFGKRSEVKDSRDRYANIEVSYLLQRMEAYRGLAVLTTNLKKALDPAFLRRLRFVVQFPFPDETARAEIWRRVFPPQTPTEGLEPERLARLGLAGGNIRNIALNAAFLAAEAGTPVRHEHVAQAARGEYSKLEKPFPEGELGRVS